MLPSLKQRLVIFVAVLIGGLLWLTVGSAVMPPSGDTGITLLDARSGLIAAVLLVILAGIPAGLLGTFVAAIANPLAGVFVFATCLWMLAAYGGDSSAFLWRVGVPGGYVWLIIEMLIWAGMYAALLTAMSRSRLLLRRRVPKLISPAYQTRSLTRQALRPSTAVACLVTTIVAALLCRLMVRDTDAGQILGSLAMAFALAAALGHAIVPGASAIGVLLSPVALAIVGYGYVIMGYGSQDELLAAWYTESLPGLAWVLPIHYASAGVAGCTLGIGAAQGLEAARAHSAESAGAAT